MSLHDFAGREESVPSLLPRDATNWLKPTTSTRAKYTIGRLRICCHFKYLGIHMTHTYIKRILFIVF